MRVFLLVLTFFLGVVQTPPAGAQPTISAQRIAATPRLLPLQKLTIGPHDQYDSTLSPDRKYLVYTQKSDLVASLNIQDLATGKVVSLLPRHADSQEAAFAPDGRLTFTYFKDNARGDICYASLAQEILRTLQDRDIKCLKRPMQASRSQRSDPFWRSANEIGFLERDIETQIATIVIENITTGRQEIAAQGKIWSPSMHSGGRYLAYNQLLEDKGTLVRHLVLRDLSHLTSRVLRFDIPGISGFPTLSEDERFLYFSHFLNDTNEDQSIDGEDNAVLFRLPLEKIETAPANEVLLPEQLTSVETSCSFAQTSGSELFTTCAFEGSLDIYRLPNTGVVPTVWGAERLYDAHRSARSYQERILLLNTLRYRTTHDRYDVDLRLFSNHIFSEDTVAARFFLKRLEKQDQEPSRKKSYVSSFYRLLFAFLDAVELKKLQPGPEISQEFRARLQRIDVQVTQINGERSLREIVRGHLRLMSEDLTAADTHIKQIKFINKPQPLERYLYFSLAESVYRRTLARNLPRLLGLYREMMTAPEFTDESRLFYAFSLLKQLQVIEPALASRIQKIESLLPGLPEPVSSLLKSEIATLRLISAKDEKEKSTVYREIDSLMIKARSHYFLRKSLYVRAILNFAEAAEFKYLTLIATGWLRDTPANDTEFIFAREVFSNAALEQAYENQGKNRLDFAGNFFYESVSLTDDLESHAGYVLTMLRKGQKSTLTDRYKNLQARSFVADNMKFVHALLDVVEADSQTSDKAVSSLDAAIVKLESMTQDRDSAVRYLLLGYCQLKKLILTTDGLEFDANLFENAHRHLMLSYDLGRDNQRIRAAALMNLGVLHQRVQNHGLSVRFFAARKTLGFVDDAERTRFTWLYSQSLGRNNRPETAAQELASLPTPSRQAPDLEREAFHLAIDGQYKKAVNAYERAFKTGQISGDLNLAKTHLTYGFALLKSGDLEKAKNALQTSLDHAQKLSVIKKGGEQKVDFYPARLQILAYGFLAQFGSREERISAHEKRGALLAQKKDIIDSWLPLLMQNHQQLASLLSTGSSTSSHSGAGSDAGTATSTALQHASDLMQESLSLTKELGESSGYIGHSVYQALSNYLVHELMYPEVYSGKTASATEVYQQWKAAFTKQKSISLPLEAMNLQLQILWSAYTQRILKTSETTTSDIPALLNSESAQRLKAALPERWQQLQTLAQAITEIKN